MKKRWWGILIFLIPLGLIVWWVSAFFGGSQQKDITVFYKVIRDTLRITVVERGTLEPKEVTQLRPQDMFKGTDLASKDSSRRGRNNALPVRSFKVQRLTPKGSKLAKGDLLVEFDYGPVQDMLERIGDELQGFLDQYDQQLNTLKIKERDLELAIEQARLSLDGGLINYDDLWQKVDRGEIEEGNIDLQRAGLAVKEQRLNLEDKEREHKIAQVILREYTAGITRTSTYYPEDLRLQPREIVNKYLKPIVDTIKEIEDRQTKFNNLMKYPDPLALYAPHPGYLFHGSHGYRGWYVEESQLSVGSSFNFTQPVCYVTNTTDMKVPISIDEIDINKIQKGLKVRVVPEALPDLALKGIVTEVSEIPGSADPWQRRRTADEESKYPVVIELEESDPRLRPKMGAKVEIMCEEIKDVLVVPIEAVFDKDGNQRVCYIRNNGVPVERVVKTGKSNEHMVIIEEGLKEGEEIYLTEPF